MRDDIVTRLREKYTGQLPICTEAADEIERLRNQHFTSSRCQICHHPEEPQLINCTNFEDELPQWVIGWTCNNTYLHNQISKRQQKQQQQ